MTRKAHSLSKMRRWERDAGFSRRSTKYYNRILLVEKLIPERVTGLQALIPLIPTKEEIVNIKEAADKGSGAFFLPPFFCFAPFRAINFVHHELN